MRLRETLLGLVVLGLVLGGVFWVRARGRPVGTAEPAPAEATLPDVTVGDCAVEHDGVRLFLAVEPRPIVAFAAHRWRVRAEAGGVAQPIEGGHLTFEMAMPMGDHRYALTPGAGGWSAAEVVLPSCPSGKRRWSATFEGTVAGVPHRARFQVDLASPAKPE